MGNRLTPSLGMFALLLFVAGPAGAAEKRQVAKAQPLPGLGALHGPDIGTAFFGDRPKESPALETEAQRWQAIQNARRPSHILSLSESYLQRYPNSPRREEVRELARRATKTLVVQHGVGLSGDLFDLAAEDLDLDDEVNAAARGDPNAAYRITVTCRAERFGASQTRLRQEQWLRFAADLGHAQASWELAEHYNLQGRVADAARYEKRAVSLGYKTPPRLSSRGY